MKYLIEKIFIISNLAPFFELAGTLILGRALVTTSNNAIKKMSSTYWDYNKSFGESLVNQRTDARFGVTMLGAGIFFQIIENIFWLPISGWADCIRALGYLFLVILLVGYLIVRRLICKCVVKKIGNYGDAALK